MATIKLSASKSANNSLAYCEKKSVITSGIHCYPEIAKDQFRITRQFWNKPDGRQVHTIIQSFKPGEVTPQQANDIGVKLAEKVINNHEAVVYTHTDKDHIHNHIVINAVNFETGKKYHSKPEDLYKIREASDSLCRAYGLSIATDHPAPLRYTLAESEIIAKGQIGWKHEIRQAIDTEKSAVMEEVFKQSTQQEILENMFNNSLRSINENPHTEKLLEFILAEAYNKLKYNLLTKYGILVNDNRKHITFQHPDGQTLETKNNPTKTLIYPPTQKSLEPTKKTNASTKKLVRGKTLGADYDREGILTALKERTIDEISRFLKQRQQHQRTDKAEQHRTPSTYPTREIRHDSLGHDERAIQRIQNGSRELSAENSIDSVQRELRRIDETVFALTSTGRAAEAERQRGKQKSSGRDERQHNPNVPGKQSPNRSVEQEQPTIPKPSPRHHGGPQR